MVAAKRSHMCDLSVTTSHWLIPIFPLTKKQLVELLHCKSIDGFLEEKYYLNQTYAYGQNTKIYEREALVAK